MAAGSSGNITQVFRIPAEELRLDRSKVIGKMTFNRIYSNIKKESKANIQIRYFVDMSVSFKVTGEQNEVLETRRRILTAFQTQESMPTIECEIPRKHRCIVIGAKGCEESMVTIECVIPRRHHRTVMGARGCMVQSIAAEFDVRIKFPDRIVWEEQRSVKQGNDEEIEALEETDLAYDVVRITGQPENAEAAKKALLNLVPITIEVDVPNYLHRSIIGPGGRDVRELKEKYGVSVILSRADQNLEYITITGTPARVEEAKEAILEKCKALEAQRQERALQSYELKIEVDSEYHPKIIGHSGSVIKKIIGDNDVAINFPRIGDPEDNIVTITGYEKNVRNAHDDIMKIIKELEQKDTMVLVQEPETQNNHAEISPCESPTSSSHEDNIGCEVTNIRKEFSTTEDDLAVELPAEEVEVRTELQKLYEKLNMSCNSLSLIREHTSIVTDALKYCDDNREHLTKLYNNEILKQKQKLKELRKELNDQASTNKALKIERTQLILEVNSEREMRGRIIQANQHKYDEEITKMSDTIKDIEESLNTEQEEKSKLAKKYIESSKRFEQLLSKHEVLQRTSTEQHKDAEYLKSSMKELEERKAQLNNELGALKDIHRVVVSDQKSKSAHYRKQLEDLKMAHAKKTSELDEAIANNMELTNTVAKRDDDINRLKDSLQQRDDTLWNLKKDLNEALEGNEKFSANIQRLYKELVAKEEQIHKAKSDFKTYKANMEEHIVREKANHEAKLKKIKSNVSDMKEKLSEMTQDIHNSSEICEMLNETQNSTTTD